MVRFSPQRFVKEKLSALPEADKAVLSEPEFRNGLLVLQRRITKYFVFPFVFGCQRAIAVGSSHHVIRFKSFSKIALPEEPSL